MLIAEDDPGVRLSLELMLTVEGYEVLLAGDGYSAVTLATEELPDAILLDHMMPKLSGREVLRQLRSDPATSSIPVLVLTGMGRGSEEEWPGATFVGKPFTPEDLLDRLQRVLEAPEGGRTATE